VGAVEYPDRNGRPKIVHYWAMTVEGGTFAPNDEVDEVTWVSLDEALELLTYERDRAVLRASMVATK
jgi:8-oxo-dGTP diphosphatase